MVMLGMTALGALLLMYLMYQPAPSTSRQEQERDPPEPQRNFTNEQLNASNRASNRFALDAQNSSDPRYM